MTSRRSEDVDFFIDHWGSEIYGQDDKGHHIWCEKVTTMKAVELLERFEIIR